MSYESENKYNIPPNFIDSATVFGGMFKARNAVEAIALAFPLAYIAFKLIHGRLEWAWEIIVLITVALPPFMLGLLGINGDSFTTFLMYWFKYRRKRRVTRYNPHLAKKKSDISAATVAKELPRDRLARMFGKNTFEKAVTARFTVYDLMSKDMVFDDDTIMGKSEKEEKKKKTEPLKSPSENAESQAPVYSPADGDWMNYMLKKRAGDDVKVVEITLKKPDVSQTQSSTEPELGKKMKNAYNAEIQKHAAAAKDKNFAAFDEAPVIIPNIVYSKEHTVKAMTQQKKPEPKAPPRSAKPPVKGAQNSMSPRVIPQYQKDYQQPSLDTDQRQNRVSSGNAVKIDILPYSPTDNRKTVNSQRNSARQSD